MDTFDWKLLDALYETHNITKAAQILYMSQPTLTKRLRRIEDEFHIPLLIRHSKGITFTPQGRLLAQQASKHVTDYMDLKESLRTFSETEVSGTLSLAANAPFARGALSYLNFGISPSVPENPF